MAKVLQFPTTVKVEYSNGIYSVMIWSPIINGYMSQGEYLSRTEAEMDAKMWRN